MKLITSCNKLQALEQLPDWYVWHKKKKCNFIELRVLIIYLIRKLTTFSYFYMNKWNLILEMWLQYF